MNGWEGKWPWIRRGLGSVGFLYVLIFEGVADPAFSPYLYQLIGGLLAAEVLLSAAEHIGRGRK